MGWELDDVERPFVEQLKGLGWTHVEGSLEDPAITGLSTFAEVIQEGMLREQLRAPNAGHDCAPWLDDAPVGSRGGKSSRSCAAARGSKPMRRPIYRSIAHPSCARCCM